MAGSSGLNMQMVSVESLDRDGRGVAHVEGKAIFIEGALPGEIVSYKTLRKKAKYEVAQVSALALESPDRVQAKCPAFGHCGGCSLQHMDWRAQMAVKQRVLEDALWHIGKVRPKVILSPIRGVAWGYRHRARLSVRLVPKKGGVLVGFHERKSSYVAVMDGCEVLPQRVSDAIPALKNLISRLSIRDRVPQIEVADGEQGVVLVFRILMPFSETDVALLARFSEEYGFDIWMQEKGPDTAKPLWPERSTLPTYLLPEFNLELEFRPTEFTQVNHAVNRILVRRAMALLNPSPGDVVGDFFCGLGNFTLPIGRLGAMVCGFEGSRDLVARAAGNASRNGIHCDFDLANLFEQAQCQAAINRLPAMNKVLIDPPRDGAMELVKLLLACPSIERIVYVACDPATLARDAGLLAQGFDLEAAGVVNMFPHTSHVESIALFTRSSERANREPGC